MDFSRYNELVQLKGKVAADRAMQQLQLEDAAVQQSTPAPRSGEDFSKSRNPASLGINPGLNEDDSVNLYPAGAQDFSEQELKNTFTAPNVPTATPIAISKALSPDLVAGFENYTDPKTLGLATGGYISEGKNIVPDPPRPGILSRAAHGVASTVQNTIINTGNTGMAVLNRIGLGQLVGSEDEQADMYNKSVEQQQQFAAEMPPAQGVTENAVDIASRIAPYLAMGPMAAPAMVNSGIAEGGERSLSQGENVYQATAKGALSGLTAYGLTKLPMNAKGIAGAPVIGVMGRAADNAITSDPANKTEVFDPKAIGTDLATMAAFRIIHAFQQPNQKNVNLYDVPAEAADYDVMFESYKAAKGEHPVDPVDRNTLYDEMVRGVRQASGNTAASKGQVHDAIESLRKAAAERVINEQGPVVNDGQQQITGTGPAKEPTNVPTTEAVTAEVPLEPAPTLQEPAPVESVAPVEPATVAPVIEAPKVDDKVQAAIDKVKAALAAKTGVTPAVTAPPTVQPDDKFELPDYNELLRKKANIEQSMFRPDGELKPSTTAKMMENYVKIAETIQRLPEFRNAPGVELNQDLIKGGDASWQKRKVEKADNADVAEPAVSQNVTTDAGPNTAPLNKESIPTLKQEDKVVTGGVEAEKPLHDVVGSFVDSLSADHNAQIAKLKNDGNISEAGALSKRVSAISKMDRLRTYTDVAIPGEMAKLPKWIQNEFETYLKQSKRAQTPLTESAPSETTNPPTPLLQGTPDTSEERSSVTSANRGDALPDGIYKTKVKAHDGTISDMYGVRKQEQDAKGSSFGDTLHKTLGEATEAQKRQIASHGTKQERLAAIAAKEAADKASKDAIETARSDIDGFAEDKPVLQRTNIQKILDKTYNYQGTTIKSKDLIKKQIADGAVIETENVPDTTERNKLEAYVTANRGRVPFGNTSHPETIAYNKAVEALKGDGPRKVEIRLVKPDGSYTKFNKTELDYAQHLIAKKNVPVQEDTKAPAPVHSFHQFKGNPGEHEINNVLARTHGGKDVLDTKNDLTGWKVVDGDNTSVLFHPRDNKAVSFDGKNAAILARAHAVDNPVSITTPDSAPTDETLPDTSKSTDTALKISPDDVPFDVAVQAFSGTSMNPERRAKDEQQGYINNVTSLYNELLPSAVLPEQKTALNDAIEVYRAKYLSHVISMLKAKNGTISSMITGRSNFKPSTRANNADDRATQAFLEWLPSGKRAVENAVELAKPADQRHQEAIETEWKKIKGKIIGDIAVVKGIDEKSPDWAGFERGAFTTSLHNLFKKLSSDGNEEMLKRAFELLDSANAKLTKPVYTERHSIWSLRKPAEDAPQEVTNTDSSDDTSAITDSEPADSNLPTEHPAISAENYDFDTHKGIQSRIIDGDITPTELKDAFEAFAENKDAIKDELLKRYDAKTLKKMERGYYPGKTKGESASNIIGQIESDFVLGGGVSYNPMAEKHIDAVRKLVNGYTAEDITAYAAKMAEVRADRAERMAKFKEALTNPQSLEDYRYLMQVNKAKNIEPLLTPEQQIQYDELVALDNKEKGIVVQERKATVQAAGAPVESEIIETIHTRNKYPLFVVKAAERVDADTYKIWNATAKKLGGWYSAYTKDGAVAGFQFKTKDNAEAFQAYIKGDAVTATETIKSVVADRAEEKKSGRADKLRTTAEKLEEDANAELNKDRLANTNKRAAQAESSDNAARKNIALAKTMLNLATAIDSGEAVHLDGVWAKVHVETLDDIVRKAMYAIIRKEHNGGLPDNKRRDPIETDVTAAEYPYPYPNKNHIKELGEHLARTINGKRDSAWLLKKSSEAGGEEYGVRFQSPEDITRLKDAMGKLTNSKPYGLQYIQEAIAPYNRLQVMKIKDLPSLRAALREYLQFKEAKQEGDKAKSLERALVGNRNVGIDFFPTPAATAQIMAEKAGIKPGMKTLEPNGGNGNLAEAMRSAGADVDVAEISSSLREILEAKDFNIVAHDFIDYNPGPIYDAIMMNPPFGGGADMEHIQHAYGMLKPGGKLVAIAGEGAFFRGGSKEVAFRDWLDENGAEVEKLPEGTFTDKALMNTTSVSARMIEIEKPDREKEAAFRTAMSEVIDTKLTELTDTRHKWEYEEYSPFSRQLANTYTRAELEKEFGKLDGNRSSLSKSHLSAIEKTSSMSSNSAVRAKSRNSMSGNYEQMQFYKNALDIYDFYPEHTKEGIIKADVPSVQAETVPSGTAASAPTWHTEIPEQGLAIEEGDKDRIHGGYAPLIGKIIDDALSAVTQIQKYNGEPLYARVLPAVDGLNGRLRLVPGEQSTPGWDYLSQEPLRVGMMTQDQLRTKLHDMLRRAPIIGDAEIKPTAVPAVKTSGTEFLKGDPVHVSDGTPEPPERNVAQRKSWQVRNYDGFIHRTDNTHIYVDKDGTGVMTDMIRRGTDTVKITRRTVATPEGRTTSKPGTVDRRTLEENRMRLSREVSEKRDELSRLEYRYKRSSKSSSKNDVMDMIKVVTAELRPKEAQLRELDKEHAMTMLEDSAEIFKDKYPIEYKATQMALSGPHGKIEAQDYLRTEAEHIAKGLMGDSEIVPITPTTFDMQVNSTTRAIDTGGYGPGQNGFERAVSDALGYKLFQEIAGLGASNGNTSEYGSRVGVIAPNDGKGYTKERVGKLVELYHDIVKEQEQHKSEFEAQMKELYDMPQQDYVIATLRPLLTKDDIKTVSDVIQAYKEGALAYEGNKSTTNYADASDKEALDASIKEKIIDKDAKFTVGKDKITITVKGEPLTEAEKGVNIEKQKELLAKAKMYDEMAARLTEEGLSEDDITLENGEKLPENQQKSKLDGKVRGLEGHASNAREDASKLNDTKNKDTKYVFWFNAEDPMAQAGKAGAEHLHGVYGKTEEAVTNARRAMRELSKVDKAFSESPILTVAAKEFDDGSKELRLVWSNGSVRFSLLPSAFGLQQDNMRLLLHPGMGKNDISPMILKPGDTVKFSPGYIDGKSDKVFITQKKQFEQHPEILYNTASALEVEHGISTSNTDGQRGSSESGTVGEMEEESELPISYRSEEYQSIPQSERDRLVISVSGEVPDSKLHEIILSEGDSRLVDISVVFGKRLVMYTLPKGYTDSGGFWHRAEPSSIYLNTASKTPHLVVLGHELVHALKKQFPTLYKELQRLNVTKPVFDHTKAESERTYKRKLKDGDVKEEVYSNYVGAKFTDAQFWENLSKQAPHIFEKMVAMVKAMIKKVLDALGGRYKTDHYFDDIKKADRIVTNVMARYAERAQNGAKERVDADILHYAAKKNTSESLKVATDGNFTPEQWDSIAEATGVSVSEVKELLGYSGPVNIDEVPIIDLIDQVSNTPFKTSTKNAVTEEERATRGLDPVEQHMKYTDPVMFAEGMRLVQSKEYDARIQAQELAKNPRPITAAEQMALLIDRTNIRNESNTVMEMIQQASSDGDNVKVLELRQRLAVLEDAFKDNDIAARKAGTEWSASGRARQLLMAEDYSYIRTAVRALVAIDKKELPPEIKARIEELTQKLEEATKKAAEYEEKIAKMEADKWVRRETNKSASTPSKVQKRAAARKEVDADFKNLADTFKKMMGRLHSIGISTDEAIVLVQMAKNRVIAGIHSAEEIVNDIYDELSGAIPEIEHRDIRDAISGYGKSFKMSQEEIAKELRELKQQMRLVSAYEDAKAGEMPLRTGLQRDPISDETRDLQKQVKQAMRESGIANVDGRSPEEQWKTALDAVKTRLNNQIHDLNKQLDTGEKTPKKIGIEYDDAAKALKAEVDRLKEALAAVEGKPEMSPEQRLKVAMSAVENNIAELERQIATRDVELKKQESKTPLTPELSDLRARRDALRKKRDDMREVIAEMKKQGAPDEDPEITKLNKFMADTERQIKAAEKATQRSIDEYNRKISEGDLEPVKKTSLTPDTPALDDLRARRDALKADYQDMQKAAKPKLSPEDRYLKIFKARMAKSMADLQNKLATGDFEKAVKKSYRLDPEAQAIKAEVGKLKNQIDIEIRRIELANRSKLEKTLDWAYKIRRAVILSGVGTLEKLTAAATMRSFVTNPLEEAISSVIRLFPIVSDIDAQAPREGGGLSVRAEAAAFKQWFMKETWKDTWEVAKTGKGQLDHLYGHHHDAFPPEWIEFFGRIHGALKNPAKRAEFSRGLQKRAEWAVRNNMDLTEPDVMAAVTSGAYIDGLRAILMDDNAAVQAFRMMLRFFDSKGDAGKVLTTAIQLGLPIVKIPSNFAAEVSLHLGGIAYAGYKTREVTKDQNKPFFDALKNIPPDDADRIMRAVKKNIVGMILLALGYSLSEYIGGFWQRGDKRKASDVKAHEINVAGHTIGKHLQHQPQMETLQAGATIKRVHDSYADAKKKGRDAEGRRTKDVYNGEGKPGAEQASLMAVINGVLKSIPFIETPRRAFDAMENPTTANRFVAEQFESLVTPPDLRKLAKKGDTYGDVLVPRQKDSLLHILMGSVPGQRAKVPINDKAVARMPGYDLYKLMDNAPENVQGELSDILRKHPAARREMNRARNGLSP